MARFPDHLFIYGTLMTSSGHRLSHILRDNGRLVGPGRIRARLYVIDEIDEHGPNAYPGAIASPHDDDVTHGELWQVLDGAAVFPAFDAYEGCGPEWPEPHEFLLRPVDVTLADGQVSRAHAYLYTWDVSRARHIPSGRITGQMAQAR